ncbi:hypothetical protein MFMK1_002366 [Metallumcola ferriviriculae]|uniref:PsbP C-terminal domain-containing protein n=1 Tax=Metallumcola ferriviriculae TaxID=3039180 RepID=A0AAU0UQ92_9FIRM|nr:hypothetical protein MFMK1_002366 [Desulfitibacteraceae bacterium MK1]
MHKKLVLAIIVVIFLVSGCSSETAQFPEREMYRHPDAGFAVQLPSTWEKVYESEQAVSFVDSELGIGFNARAEFGGLSFYNVESLADEVIKVFEDNKNFTDIDVISEEQTAITESSYKLIFESTDSLGIRLGTKVFIFDIYPGIRYYLAFTADKETYYRYDQGFDWLAQSFFVTKDYNELYQALTPQMPEGHPETENGGKPSPETNTDKDKKNQ